MSIRPARKEDALQAAELFDDVLGEIGCTLTGSREKQTRLKIFADFFTQEVNRLSYNNAFVKEVDGKVVGIIVAYPGSESEMLDSPIVNRLRLTKNDPTITIDKEAEEQDYYIDSLCVLKAFWGRGVATALIKTAEEKAMKLNSKRISLNVEEENERAYRLYRFLGYRAEKATVISNIDFQYMVKDLAALEESCRETE